MEIAGAMAWQPCAQGNRGGLPATRGTEMVPRDRTTPPDGPSIAPACRETPTPHPRSHNGPMTSLASRKGVATPPASQVARQRTTVADYRRQERKSRLDPAAALVTSPPPSLAVIQVGVIRLGAFVPPPPPQETLPPIFRSPVDLDTDSLRLSVNYETDCPAFCPDRSHRRFWDICGGFPGNL
jgi:hypothetical protein